MDWIEIGLEKKDEDVLAPQKQNVSKHHGKTLRVLGDGSYYRNPFPSGPLECVYLREKNEEWFDIFALHRIKSLPYLAVNPACKMLRATVTAVDR